MNDWWKKSVVYQIYPRSFADSNNDGIGDLGGIIDHLPYLKKLGVDVIWLSPVYQSPNDDNGYDISDYQEIMPEFGTMEDFDKMLAAIHELDMHLVMDLVVNHTSDEHEWFKKSRQSKDNPYRDFYIWRKGREGKTPNNWGSEFGGSAWEYDEQTEMYYLHCFSKKQPDLNWENPQVRKQIYEMMRWWLDRGVDGFRMDVINMISKPEGLPDGEITEGVYGNAHPLICDGPKVHDYLQEMNREVLSKYDVITVGEALDTTLDEAQKYSDEARHELNMVFHFEHVSLGEHQYGKWTNTPVPMPELRSILNKWQMGLAQKGWNSLYWGNHDQPRAVSRFGDDRPLYREISAKMLATCLHMMKGTPYIYQGEELGMINPYFSKIDQYKDIESIHAYKDLTTRGVLSAEEMISCLKVISRDNARTPMQWTDGVNGGFTAGTPWIECAPTYLSINAKKAESDPNSVFAYYQRLIELRKKYDIIVEGDFQPVLLDSDDIYAYYRSLSTDRLYVFCNFTAQTVDCGEIPEDGDELLSNYVMHKVGKLQPYEARAVMTHGK